MHTWYKRRTIDCSVTTARASLDHRTGHCRRALGTTFRVLPTRRYFVEHTSYFILVAVSARARVEMVVTERQRIYRKNFIFGPFDPLPPPTCQDKGQYGHGHWAHIPPCYTTPRTNFKADFFEKREECKRRAKPPLSLSPAPR